MSAAPEPDELHRSAVSYLPTIHRLMPNAPEAEKGVLCSFLLCPREIGQMCVEQGITADHFYFPAHGLIYSVLLEFWHENEPLDVISLTVDMRNKGTLAQVGGAGFLTDLCSYLPTAANASNYLEILREKYILREVIKIGTEAARRGYDEQDNVPKLLGDTVDQMMKIVRLAEGQKTHSRTMRELMLRSMQRIDKRLAGDWKIEMPTGIRALDKVTMGFKAPEVTMVLGKPSDGKSSLAMNIAEHLALHHGKRVGVISMDDSDDQLSDRLIQARARVSRFEIEQTGQLNDPDYHAITKAMRELAEAPIYIRDDGGLTPSEINATFSAWKAKDGLDFGIIDHIQLAQCDGRSDSRTSAAEQVSRTLKPMAKRFGIPLLVLSQVTEDSPGNYVTKNTRALGEDANNLWVISRVKDSTDAWIKIDKQKDGPRGISVPVMYEQAFTRFSDRAKAPEDDQPELVNMGKSRPKQKKG